MIKWGKFSDYKIKKIIKHFIADIDAIKTSILLEINRNTINRYYHIFRKVIFEHQSKERIKISGEVEIDESYFGAKRIRGLKGKQKRGRVTKKQPVFGVYERDGRVFTEIIPDCKKKTLQRIITGKISIESIVHTDAWKGYDDWSTLVTINILG